MKGINLFLRSGAMGQGFIVPDLFIYSDEVRNVMSPRLNDDMKTWLENSGIRDHELQWIMRPRQPHSNITVWDTAIVFKDARDAILFKLAWS